jgi:energy-coupling factor transporter ATP-binding protein EcfA2
MARSRHRPRTLAAPPPDPFGERCRVAWRERRQLLGARFEFETDSRELLEIVRAAYARLPAHRLAQNAPRLRVRLVLSAQNSGGAAAGRPEPQPVRALSAGGILCGASGPASFVALSPHQRAALIVVGRDMLRYPYHLRYELLEFAVYVLAARSQALTPLHAGCVGQRGAGVLLIGASGSGKSTLVSHCALAGLELLAEDSVLVRPADLRATGVASFLHLRHDALRFLDATGRNALLGNAPLIRRRSGVEKLEIDLRRPPYRLAAAPLEIRAVVFLSAARRRSPVRLEPVARRVALKRVAATQRYAATQPGWQVFRKALGALPAYQLGRGAHPREAVATLRELLADLRACR